MYFICISGVFRKLRFGELEVTSGAEKYINIESFFGKMFLASFLVVAQ